MTSSNVDTVKAAVRFQVSVCLSLLVTHRDLAWQRLKLVRQFCSLCPTFALHITSLRQKPSRWCFWVTQRTDYCHFAAVCLMKFLSVNNPLSLFAGKAHFFYRTYSFWSRKIQTRQWPLWNECFATQEQWMKFPWHQFQQQEVSSVQFSLKTKERGTRLLHNTATTTTTTHYRHTDKHKRVHAHTQS